MSYNREKLKNSMEKARMIFIEEIKDRLTEAQKAMMCIKTGGYDVLAVENLYKFTHTLRGSGETIGMFEIAHPASEMNSALKLVKDYEVKLEKGMIMFLEERLKEIIDEINDNHSENNQPLAVSKPLDDKTIYVIDDDAAVTSLVQEALLEEGFKVIAFHETHVAEEYINIERPDLIILDIVLSTEEEGIEFCRKIRSLEYSKLIPIIFLTRKNELNDKLKGFANGADDYMCKPFQIEELIARVHSILNRLELHQNLILQDDLTGVYNRRYMEQRLTEEVARSKRTGKSFSIAMVDIDFFKKINDQYGHAVGDEALQCLVEMISKKLRVSDVFCRYGGEEFIIILPETSRDVAYGILERLREEVAKKAIALPKSQLCLDMTISIGVAGFDKDGGSVEELIRLSDLAMYDSKVQGRNKVSMSRGKMI